MAIKRGKHAVYDIEYHFVWVPKYRKHILTKQLKKRVEELFRAIAEQYVWGTPISQSSPYVLFISLLLLPPALVLVSLLDSIGSTLGRWPWMNALTFADLSRCREDDCLALALVRATPMQ